MGRPRFAAGIDIGGTRIKLGVVDLDAGTVLSRGILDTEKAGEQPFFDAVSRALTAQLSSLGLARERLVGVGVSIGSYVFSDGTIDGMSGFIPFLVCGYPLRERMERALSLAARVDNDARLIGLAEAVFGAGRGASRCLTLTLGTGIGVGLCVDGRPCGDEAHQHLAGHIMVRRGDEYPCLDDAPCYCGLRGCFESTCSGGALERRSAALPGGPFCNAELFARAGAGEPGPLSLVGWYMDMLLNALNQYVYLYCPDRIVLGGGISRGLEAYCGELDRRLAARVYSGQRTRVCLSWLMEDAGILGAATQFAR